MYCQQQQQIRSTMLESDTCSKCPLYAERHRCCWWMAATVTTGPTVFTARRSYASAVLGVVILSARLYVTRVLCDKTKQCIADILIPHERVISLLFWHQHWLVGNAPSVWNLRSKWSTPFEKRRLRQISAYNVLTVRDSEKSSVITNNKSTMGFPRRYRWSVYVP